MCLGHPPKIQIQVVIVVCSFDVYRVSQSGIIMEVEYAKDSTDVSTYRNREGRGFLLIFPLLLSDSCDRC